MRVCNTSGMHSFFLQSKDENNIFYCQLIVNDIVIDGQGITKKKAEQDASKNTLKYYNVL